MLKTLFQVTSHEIKGNLKPSQLYDDHAVLKTQCISFTVHYLFCFWLFMHNNAV